MICNLGNRNIRIDDAWIEKTMKALEMTRDEVVQMYLEDEGYLENEEQSKLDENAKSVKISHGASADEKKNRKPRTSKTSDEKQALFSEIYQNLKEKFGENVEIVKENKLLTVKQGEKVFKIDIIEQRPPK